MGGIQGRSSLGACPLVLLKKRERSAASMKW